MAKKKDSLAIFSDKPTDIDLLNFKDYSNLLADVIETSETPSTIGVFGAWGSGKTSLMLMIEKKLKKKKIKTIWFNAWKYDKEDALWRALILRILKGLTASQKDVDDATLKLYAAISTDKLGQVEIDWLEIGKALMKGVAFFVSPFLLIPGVANAFAKADFLDNASSAFTRRKIQQSQERVSSIEQFEELYKQLVAKHITDNERIVIFIDDLDRCLPVRSLEVFEALKSFLDADGCIYVVSCDTRLINQGLQLKYSDKSNISLDDYLEKIVQFAFSIPPIHVEDAERFIKKFGLAIGSDEIARLISRTLERNPRKIKRFLSDLKIKSQLVKSRKLLLRPETLVKMSCITYTWREFWLASVNDTSVFSRAQQIAISSNGNEKSLDDIEFGNLFHIDERLYGLLNTEPFVADSDLHEFIFLSTTTSTNLAEKLSQESAGDVFERQSVQTKIYSDKPVVDQRFNVTKARSDEIIAAINNNASLIVISGHVGTGKTTLLYIIEQFEKSNFVSVYIDLGRFMPSINLDDWYFEMARVTKQTMEEKGYSLNYELKGDRFSLASFEKFLYAFVNTIKGKRLVLMLDESIQLVREDPSSNSFTNRFVSDLRTLLLGNDRLTIILSGQFRSKDLSGQVLHPLLDLVSLTVELDKLGLHNFNEIYERLNSLPLENYNISEAYNLLYLFENELRLFVATQFSLFDWWKQGLSENLYEKAARSEMTLDLFSLGDLFKVIMVDGNWERIFKKMFPSKTYIGDKASIILRVRNKIAHSRELATKELEEFVLSTLEILKIIHNINSR